MHLSRASTWRLAGLRNSWPTYCLCSAGYAVATQIPSPTALQVLTSLAFLHSLGLVHADLKPENILVKSYSQCRVKVIDLGSSCFLTDHLSSYVQVVGLPVCVCGGGGGAGGCVCMSECQQDRRAFQLDGAHIHGTTYSS